MNEAMATANNISATALRNKEVRRQPGWRTLAKSVEERTERARKEEFMHI